MGSHSSSGGGGSGGGSSGTRQATGEIFRTMREAKEYIRELAEARAVVATEGARMPLYQGRRIRVGGTVIYDSNQNKTSDWYVTGTNAVLGLTVVQKLDTYTVDLAIAFGQAVAGPDGTGKVSEVITIAAGGRKIWTLSNPDAGASLYESLEIHKGNRLAAVSSTMESIKGSGKTSAWRDTVVVIIKGFKLAEFGNTTPVDWEAILKPDDQPYSVADALADLWAALPNRTSGELDVSNVTGGNTSVAGDSDDVTADGDFEGALWEGPTTPRQAMEIIESVYDLYHRERAGVLYYYDRGSEDIYEVPDLLDAEGNIIGCAWAGTSPGKADTSRPIDFHNPVKVNKIPTESVIGFYSKKMEYQKDSTRKRLKNDADTDGVNIVSIDVPLVLTQKASRRVASRAIVQAHKDAIEGRIQLPPDCIDVEAQDILAIYNRADDQRYYLRADEVTMGADFMVMVSGQVVEIRSATDTILTSIPSAFQGTDEPGDTIDSDDDNEPGIGDPDNPDEDDVYYVQAMRTIVADAPPLRSSDCSSLTWLFAHALLDHAGLFLSATVFRSNDAASGYEKQTDPAFGIEYPVGIALTALAAAADPSDGQYLDLGNTVDIVLCERGGSLASLTDWQFWNTDFNRFLVGSEVIQARDVSLLAAASASGEMSINASTHQVSRSSGSFVTDGFAVNQLVRLRGFTNDGIDPIRNDRVEFILAVTATVLTISILQGDTLVTEGPTADVTVTALESNTAYRLSHLKRGLRDTIDHHDGHAVGESVIRYQTDYAMPISLGDAQLGNTKYFRSVPSDGSKNDDIVVTTAATMGGNSERPFQPAHLHYLRGDQIGGVANDVYIRWVHNSREPGMSPVAQAQHALLEPSGKDKYTVEIYSNAGLTTLLRSLTRKWDDHADNKIRYYEYSAANQTADGITPGAQVWVRVQQKGDIVFDGNWSETLHVKAASAERPESAGMAAAAATEGTV